MKDAFRKPGQPENEDGEWITGVNSKENWVCKKTKPLHIMMTR